MRVPSSQDQEALDALFRKARSEPSPEHVLRVKQQLHALAREIEPPPARSGSGGLAACIAVGVASLTLGLGFMLGARETVASDVGQPQAVVAAVSATTPISPDVPATREAVPVEDLAPVEEAQPAKGVASDQNALPRERRPAPARAEPAKPVVAEQAMKAEASREVLPTTPKDELAPGATAVEPAGEPALKGEGEASFLRRAKVALGRDPALALRLTDEHPEIYPRGVLLQEREVIAIEALVRLGRANEARSRAASFRARYPSSAYHGHLDDQIERVLAGSPNDAPR